MKPSSVAGYECYWYYTWYSLCYLVHVPLSLLLSLQQAVWVLSLVRRHWGLLLHAHITAVWQSPARHHAPAGRKRSAHSWGETLCAELHLRLAQEHACSTGQSLHL